MARTVGHFWPEWSIWLRRLQDTRVQDDITYPRQFLIWEALMAFLLKLGSRRQVRFELDSPEALANLNSLSGCAMEARAHSDTLEHFLGHVPPGALDDLRQRMIQRLLRMKALEHGRLLGHYLIVLDGTGQLYFRQRHCRHCLTAVVAGQIRYYHHVLEAKLVTPAGLALSIGSEYIENADPQATKQDCELKAFARLVPRLKKQYPQLQICLLLDGLYACGRVFQTCADYHWKYLVTFKEGSLPAVWQEYQTLGEQCPANRKNACGGPQDQPQKLAWVEGLEYRDEQNRRHRFQALECREGHVPALRRFAWLTNFRVTDQNVATLVNRGGRCRWKIENEGFNIQKNGGFNLEHAYSTATVPMKNWYVLLQIAHTILQLLERGSLLGAPCQQLFGSLRNLARRLAESLRNRLISPEALDAAAAAAIQIRLSSA